MCYLCAVCSWLHLFFVSLCEDFLFDCRTRNRYDGRFHSHVYAAYGVVLLKCAFDTLCVFCFDRRCEQHNQFATEAHAGNTTSTLRATQSLHRQQGPLGLESIQFVSQYPCSAILPIVADLPGWEEDDLSDVVRVQRVGETVRDAHVLVLVVEDHAAVW